MDGLRLDPNLVVDRHHRGAIVMTARGCFVLPESLIALVEQIAAGDHCDADARASLEQLVTRGVLCRRSP
jgi:hypothetical protein